MRYSKGRRMTRLFHDTFDSYEGLNGHDSLGKSGSALSTKIGTVTGGSSAGESESHHTRERKHEAFMRSVRLCNKDGDVLWSTTQESLGGKFRGASADVAAKIAHQIQLDYHREQKAEEPETPPITPAATTPK